MRLENQMEKNIEVETETGILKWFKEIIRASAEIFGLPR